MAYGRVYTTDEIKAWEAHEAFKNGARKRALKKRIELEKTTKAYSANAAGTLRAKLRPVSLAPVAFLKGDA